MFQMAQLEEDALREYDELEQCYLESGFCHLFTLTTINKI